MPFTFATNTRTRPASGWMWHSFGCGRVGQRSGSLNWRPCFLPKPACWPQHLVPSVAESSSAGRPCWSGCRPGGGGTRGTCSRSLLLGSAEIKTGTDAETGRAAMGWCRECEQGFRKGGSPRQSNPSPVAEKPILCVVHAINNAKGAPIPSSWLSSKAMRSGRPPGDLALPRGRYALTKPVTQPSELA
jgi:hypothetical protein